ncbi:MAG TPA: hypothetical protein ENH62_01450 [Marinobacter sp.]|nr:hypothetical protein [Marinobacter sp.]
MTEGRVDRRRSPFVEGYPDYPEKVLALARILDTDQFLWAVDAARGFRGYEMCKPVEWEVNVSQGRVLGYVDDDPWFAFLEGKCSTFPCCFSKDRPDSQSFSVLLPFPLRQDELILRRVYKVENPDRASILSEEILGMR